MLKHELRKEFRSRRALLIAEELETDSLKISNRLLQLPIWKFSFFHLFLPIEKNKEVDTFPVLTLLQGKDKNIVLPKVGKDGTLKNYLLTDDTVLKESNWGIPEPKNGIEIAENKIEVVFVPLLAFDKLGNRVGYGKGYYDRLLASCNTDVVKIGLSFFEPVDKIMDTEPTDIALSYCVTPNATYQF